MTSYEAYLELYQQVGAMQNKLKETAKEVIKQMTDENIEKIQGTVGSITRAKRKTYTYSNELRSKEVQLQEKANDILIPAEKEASEILAPVEKLKKAEEEMGVAKVEEKEYLRVTIKPLI